MSRFLELWPGAQPCMRSGFCCKQGPCAFGTWDTEKKQCAHLVGNKPGEYACGIVDEILTKPGWELNPAFGAGCCSALNSDRLKLLKERNNEEK